MIDIETRETEEPQSAEVSAEEEKEAWKLIEALGTRCSGQTVRVVFMALLGFVRLFLESVTDETRATFIEAVNSLAKPAKKTDA